MYPDSCINKNKDNSYDDTKKDIDKIIDEFFSVDSYFLQNSQCFSAALIFKLLIGKFHGMLQSICKNLGTEFLDHHVHKIILEILRNPAHHGNTNRKQ